MGLDNQGMFAQVLTMESFKDAVWEEDCAVG